MTPGKCWGSAGHTSHSSRRGIPDVGHQWVVSIVQDSDEGRPARADVRQWLPSWRRFLKGLGPVVRSQPQICIIPLLLMLLLAGLSSLGVVLAAKAEERTRRQAAAGFAQDTATGFELKLANSLAPVLALSVFVRDTPSVPEISARFDSVASELLTLGRTNTSAFSEGTYLRLAPQGVITMAFPRSNAQSQLIGLNLLTDHVRRAATLETIRRKEVTIQGPIMLKQEGFVGIVMRIPIYVSNVTNPNETFGAPQAAYNCSICYDRATKTRWWGIAGTVVDFEQIAGGSGITDGRATTGPTARHGPYHGLLGRLEQQGFIYALTVPQPGGTPIVIAQTPEPLRDPISARIQSPTNEEWLLQVEPQAGWVSGWRNALLAMVNAISLAMGALLLCLAVNRQQQAWLLSELRTNNKELISEKLRTDALLARQFHLINCLMEQGGRLAPMPRRGPSGGGGGGGGGGGAAGAGGGTGGAASKPDDGRVPSDSGTAATDLDSAGMALERIEDMKRSIGGASGTATAGAIQLLELLGEGGFGKVYKGLWHGTVVAVKTMILPAHMSGAQKRERMAIMEAAISSAMAHPNIVQTFTYVIKPMASTHSALSSHQSQSMGTREESEDALQAGPNILNFEVSLVLEFCELGSVRDALDGGAFHGPDGTLNFAAVLDVASDVARAMLHLHSQQVLHSDLKARNVLLKGDARRGGGAVAKVADFGLALPMSGHDTHVSAYQGTPSHMSPESHLHGRMSKAGDVYAFGILMWELYTAGRPFEDVPGGLLGHRVSIDGLRPAFASGTPEAYCHLAASCWASQPADRPRFDRVLELLVAMRAGIPGRTPPLAPYDRATTQRRRALYGVPESSWGDPADPVAEAGQGTTPGPADRLGVTFGGPSFTRRLDGGRNR